MPTADNNANFHLGPDAPDTPSVLRIINRSNARLEALLPNLGGKQDASQDLLEIADNLIKALELNTDIALATIFLNQIAGIYAVRHCIETALVALVVAKANGNTPEQMRTIACAALTMNIGMLDFHETMQSRSLLSSDEQRAIFRHPELSAQILRQAGIDDPAWLDCVENHHENPDGSGYPQGKSGNAISPGAHLLALADRYCAQVSARNYRKSLSPSRALQALASECGNDDPLYQLFASELGAYPPGSFVQLANGEIGVVSARRANHSPAPQVHALIGPTGVPLLPTPVVRDCNHPYFQIQASLHEDEADIRFGMKQIWGAQASL